MATCTRRRILRDLSLVSAAALAPVPLYSFSPARKKKATTCTLTGSADLYIIVSGPWLFGVDQNKNCIHAITINDSAHEYLAGELPPGNRFAQRSMDKAEAITVSVTGAGSSPVQQLISPLATGGVGLVYSKSVVLTQSLPTNLRTVSLPLPSSIQPLALLQNTNYFSYNPTDLQNANGAILQWPFALAFVYKGWRTATFTSSNPSTRPVNITNDSVTPTHIQFCIMMHLSSCPSNDPHCYKLAAQHGHDFFAQLMQLLTFAGQRPGVTPPITQVHYDIGKDSNILACELGLSDQGYPMPLNYRFHKEGRIFSGTLVNCASGGGGIHNCC